MGAKTATSSKKPTRPYKPKVKTGCMSCRTRRVKCDEAKPSCNRCLQTGRICDGYEDLFRPLQWTPVSNKLSTPPTMPRREKSPAGAPTPRKARAHSPPCSVVQIHTPPLTPPSQASTATPAPIPAPAQLPIIIPRLAPGLMLPQVARQYISHLQLPSPAPEPLPAALPPTPTPCAPPVVTEEEIAAFSRHFSNKHVAGGYVAEARATLLVSRTEPAVRHAMNALTSVHETLENHGRARWPAAGLEEYNNAIKHLTPKMPSDDPRAVEVVLLCNRIFMSIEVMLRSYKTCTQHYFVALRIMHQAGARAHVDASNRVVPAQNPHLPKVDLFMLKIFTARDELSPQLREMARAVRKGTMRCGRKMSTREFAQMTRLARSDIRAYRAKGRLLAVAERVVEFLDKVTGLRAGADAFVVVEEKRILLGLLEHMWDEFQAPDDGRKEFGPYHKRFLSMFHTALWIPLYLSLWPPTRNIDEMMPLFERISGIASNASRGKGKLMDAQI